MGLPAERTVNKPKLNTLAHTAQFHRNECPSQCLQFTTIKILLTSNCEWSFITHNCDLFVLGPEFAILKIPLPEK